MTKFILEVKSSIERPSDSTYYGRGTTTPHPVTKAEIYEAVSVYLRAKGFKTEVVSVKEKSL